LNEDVQSKKWFITSTPDGDEHKYSEAVEVLAVGLARSGEGQLRFAGNARALKVVCTIVTETASRSSRRLSRHEQFY